jgi:copper chaperone CopZ
MEGTMGRLMAGIAALLLLLAASATAGQGKQVLRETTIAVSGMFCSSCSSTVEQALKKLDGVVEARADLKDDRVRVRYDGDKVTPRRMAEAIRKAGYQASLPGGQAPH